LGNPLRFILSPGQASDFTHAKALIAELPADHVLGDKGYDSKALRDDIVEQGAVAVIPPRTTSPQVACDYALYCERNLIERFFLRSNTSGVSQHATSKLPERSCPCFPSSPLSYGHDECQRALIYSLELDPAIRA
jgi:transposase